MTDPIPCTILMGYPNGQPQNTLDLQNPTLNQFY